MSNICEVEEIELSTKGQQPTLMDLYIEMNRLKRENECLKADNIELHNRLNVNTEDISMLNKYEEEYLCGCESEEDLKAMQKAYAEFV